MIPQLAYCEPDKGRWCSLEGIFLPDREQPPSLRRDKQKGIITKNKKTRQARKEKSETLFCVSLFSDKGKTLMRHNSTNKAKDGVELRKSRVDQRIGDHIVTLRHADNTVRANLTLADAGNHTRHTDG